MSSALAPYQRRSWFARAFQAISRALSITSEPEQFTAGADYATETAQRGLYSIPAALSAYGAFPWVKACAEVIADDLSGLPLELYRGTGSDAERITEHPILDLLAQPTSYQTRQDWESQLIIYWLLCGNAYALQLGGGDLPSSLPLLHPQRTSPIPDVHGGPRAYQYSASGSPVYYDPADVLVFRSPSWADGPSSLVGQGLIQALNNDLEGDLAAAQLWSRTAQRGRPDAIISPAGDGDFFDEDLRKDIARAYERIVEKGGAMVSSGHAKVDFVNLSARDMEYSQGRQYTRETILAAFGVPPTKVGLPSANFATAKEQDLQYWSRQRARAARIDAQLTRLARRYDPELRIVHSFSGVSALQEDRSAQIQRINTWWLMGVPLAEAAALEGVEELNRAEAPPAPANQDEQPAAEDQQRSPLAQLFNDLDAHIDRAVGDVDPTNFPADGDDEIVSLDNSQWAIFDPEYAERLKLEYPQIWSAGGNVLGNRQFRRLRPIALRDNREPETRTEEEAIRLREAWGARHFEDFRLAGVVAQIKWLVIGSRGERYMKDLITAEIAKLEERDHREDHEDEDPYDVVWRQQIEEIHTPAERDMSRDMVVYFRGQAERLAERLGEVLPETPSAGAVQRGVTAADVVDQIYDDATEQFQLFAALGLTLRQTLDVSFQAGAEDTGVEVEQSVADRDNAARIQVDTLAVNLSPVTKAAVERVIESGLLAGETINEIQTRLIQAAAFSPTRALAVARTESTKALNQGAQMAYNAAEVQHGLTVYKRWVSARDSSVRESHRLMDGQTVPQGAKFQTPSGEHGSGPGQFASAAEVVNCRCTIIPIVERNR